MELEAELSLRQQAVAGVPGSRIEQPLEPQQLARCIAAQGQGERSATAARVREAAEAARQKRASSTTGAPTFS